jgi:hypothetical protein
LQLSAWGWSLGPRHLAPMIPFWVLVIGWFLHPRHRWSVWARRVTLALAFYSIVAVVLPTAVFGGFPPDFSNPLADFTFPLLVSGCMSPSVGTAMGLSPGWAALPFWLGLVALLTSLFYKIGDSWRIKVACLLVSGALITLVLCITGRPDPVEGRALDWVRRDILQCESAQRGNETVPLSSTAISKSP